MRSEYGKKRGEKMKQKNNNAAKFAFFYMLSLVALIFMALNTGIIVFQIVNKSIVDVIDQYSGRYSPSLLKVAMSSLIISTPIFYLTIRQIYKSLFSGALDKDSGVRKWLTYFIMFISSVVMIGWLIGIVNSFFEGDLTIKFILKAITAIGIAAGVFSFYLYDIRREEVLGKKDKVIRIYLYGSLAVVVAVFTSSLFFVESPTETRNRKMDSAILSSFNKIGTAINDYYNDEKKLPESLEEIAVEFNYVTDRDLKDPVTDKGYEYKIVGNKKYELCATFRTSNKDIPSPDYLEGLWPHAVGYQCLRQRVKVKD